MYTKSINLPIGRRLTKPKQLILDYFTDNKVHITAEMLFEILKFKVSNIGLATIYRNLNDLASSGILKQLSFPGLPLYYELADGHHTHFYCEYCHHIYDVEAPGKKIETNRAWQGHYIKDANVELRGICKNCMVDYFG